jgi:hypothetical protein
MIHHIISMTLYTRTNTDTSERVAKVCRRSKRSFISLREGGMDILLLSRKSRIRNHSLSQRLLKRDYLIEFINYKVIKIGMWGFSSNWNLTHP